MQTTSWKAIGVAAALALVLVGYQNMSNQIIQPELTLIEGANDRTVITGTGKVYLGDDGFFYAKNDAGEITQLTGPGGGSVVAGGGASNMQFSPAEMYDDVIVPWRRLTGMEDAITDANSLTLVMGAIAATGGTATLQMIAEYYVDHTAPLLSSLDHSYSSRIQGTFISDGGTSLASVDADATDIEGDDSSPATFLYSEMVFRLTGTPVGGSSVITQALLNLHFAEMPSGTIRITAAKNSAAPSIPTDTTTYNAMTRTTAYVDVEAGVGAGSPGVLEDVDITSIIDEVEAAVGQYTSVLIIVTPQNPAVGSSATFVSPWAILQHTPENEELLRSQGPQGIIYEGTTLTTDPEELTAKEIAISLEDTTDPRVVVLQNLNWTPELYEFSFATETHCRVKITQKPETGTLASPPAIFVSGLLIGPTQEEEGS